MISVVTSYLNEFASADLRGVVVVGEGHAQLASFQVHSSLKTQGFNLLGSLTFIIFQMSANSLIPTLNFFPPIVSMSHSLPMVKVLVTLAFVG